MPASRWNAFLSIIVAVLSAPGRTSAAGTDKLVPVTLATNAPGMIRFDSCAYPAQEAKQNHQATVTLRFLAGADGKVNESLMMKISGHLGPDNAALVATSKCAFRGCNNEPS